MLDIGWSELLILGVVLILVVGPRELPGMLRNFGRTMGQMRKMASEFQSQFNDALKEAELDEVKRSIDDVRNMASKTTNPLKAAGEELKSAIEDTAKPVPTKPGPSSTSKPAAPAPAPNGSAAVSDPEPTTETAKPVPTASGKPSPDPEPQATKAAS